MNVFPSQPYKDSKGCVFRLFKDIKESGEVIKTAQSLETSIKTGGYFQIQKKMCTIKEDNKTDEYNI